MQLLFHKMSGAGRLPAVLSQDERALLRRGATPLQCRLRATMSRSWRSRGRVTMRRSSQPAAYFLNPSSNLAEIAYMIAPAWQGTGLGSALQKRLKEFAVKEGVRGFVAEILPGEHLDNSAGAPPRRDHRDHAMRTACTTSSACSRIGLTGPLPLRRITQRQIGRGGKMGRESGARLQRRADEASDEGPLADFVAIDFETGEPSRRQRLRGRAWSRWSADGIVEAVLSI